MMFKHDQIDLNVNTVKVFFTSDKIIVRLS